MKIAMTVLSAALIAMGTFAASAQSNSSNTTMAPVSGGGAKTETPGANAQVKGTTKQPDPSKSSSNPTMAPVAGGAKKTESPGTNAKVSGTTKQPDPSHSSSNPTMAPK